MKKILFLLISLVSITAFSQNSKGKIGVVFNISGPFKIFRNAVYNITANDKNLEEDERFYDVVQFLGTPKGNPRPLIEEYYKKLLSEKGYEVITINETINEENFPKFSEKQKKTKFYELDIRSLKNKYNVDKLIIVKGQYGLEVEMIGAFGGDKRTNIGFSNYFVDTNSNIVEKEFYVMNIKNIRKKDLINPPDYPNVTESMNRLLNERIFPDLKLKLESW